MHEVIVDWHSLEPPHTYVYTGPMSTTGQRINRFALSLKSPANRTSFLADSAAAPDRFPSP